jgi:hypothetical protein
VVIYVETEEEYARVALHLLGHALAEGVDVPQNSLFERVNNRRGCLARRRHR